jgi:aminopeptidase YwaD
VGARPRTARAHPEHTRIRAALHRLEPAAVIAVSDHWQPILEDPELGFPSTTVPRALGASLRDDDEVGLTLEGAVHRGLAANLSARTGGAGRRLVLSAHLDSKVTTPGAFDNAAGVATLLALAEDGLRHLGAVELVLFNGEDHFDAGGEQAWLAATDLGEVAANVNLDGVGLAGRGTSLAALACPEGLEAELDRWVARRPGWTRAAPWFESDHAIFAMQGVPALAVTSEDVHALLGGLAHTPADTLDVLDLAVLEELMTAVPELLALLRRGLPPSMGPSA